MNGLPEYLSNVHFETMAVWGSDPDEITVDTVRDAAGLKALAPYWDKLSTQWASPMKSHDWIQTCANVFGIDRSLEIMVAAHHRTLAAAPLYRSESRLGVQRLELIGENQLYEVMDFLFSDPSQVAPLAKAIVRSRLPIRLSRVPANSPIPAALQKAYGRSGKVVCRPSVGVPWISLGDSWVNPEQHVNPGRRSDLRRALRIAQDLGWVKFEIISPDRSDLPHLLASAYATEASSWKAHSGSTLAGHPLQGEFFQRYAAAACEKGILRLCFMRIDGRVAAMQIAIESGHRFWLLKIGYSDEFARCSPGMLLMRETIAHAARAGLKSYEFLGVDERWVRMWTSRVHPYMKVYAYPFNHRGAAAFAEDAGVAIMKKTRAALEKRAVKPT